MTRRRIASLLLNLFIISLAVYLPARTQNPISFVGACIRVTDGDTIHVAWHGNSLKIRIFGIDCPELSQPFGPEARQFSRALALGKEVRIDKKGMDRYGRIIARVLINGSDLGRELIESGLAWQIRKFCNDRDYIAALARARNGKIGLWSQPHPVPPWRYRHQEDGAGQ